MEPASLVISALAIVLVPASGYILFRGTALDVSRLSDNPWPILWYWTVALVLLPLLIVCYTGIAGLGVFHLAHPGLELSVALTTGLTLLMYVASLAVFLRLLGLTSRRLFGAACQRFGHARLKISRLAFALALLGTVLLAGFHALGYKHAFLGEL